MQQKSNKFFTAKERILQYLDLKGYTQYDFSKKTGLSNGFLKSGRSISSDNIKLLSTIYTDLNIMWLITGEGDMLRGISADTPPPAAEKLEQSEQSNDPNNYKDKYFDLLEKYTATLEELRALQKKHRAEDLEDAAKARTGG
jgi:transcriptional regulator with XRE-family HTH domain